jgi:hypothetical protein
MNAIDTLRREFEKQLATPSLKQMAQERGARGDTILCMLGSWVNTDAQVSEIQAEALINEIFEVWAGRPDYPSFQELCLTATYINTCKA